MWYYNEEQNLLGVLVRNKDNTTHFCYINEGGFNSPFGMSEFQSRETGEVPGGFHPVSNVWVSFDKQHLFTKVKVHRLGKI